MQASQTFTVIPPHSLMRERPVKAVGQNLRNVALQDGQHSVPPVAGHLPLIYRISISYLPDFDKYFIDIRYTRRS
jgi:hypothetical protein